MYFDAINSTNNEELFSSIKVKIQGQNNEMLRAACEQFLGKRDGEIMHIARETLEGHQRAIMGTMSVEEIYKDRKKFSKHVFEVASSDLVNMGITVVSYTIKDISDDEVRSIIRIFSTGTDTKYFHLGLFESSWYGSYCRSQKRC